VSALAFREAFERCGWRFRSGSGAAIAEHADGRIFFAADMERLLKFMTWRLKGPLSLSGRLEERMRDG
jgi:hypothetical protein